MVGTSKVLTVSYGTFSCTLEGFDDSFSTMKAIAEYFRDLAAEDRYFGAEPPTPDAEMLARIAESELSRRVHARVDGTGVVLSPPPQDEDRPAAAPVQEPEIQSELRDLEKAEPEVDAPLVEDVEDIAPQETLEAEAEAVVQDDKPNKRRKSDKSRKATGAVAAAVAGVAAAGVASASSASAEQATDDLSEAAVSGLYTDDDDDEYFDNEVISADVVDDAEDADSSSVAAKLRRIRAVVQNEDSQENNTGYSEDEHAVAFFEEDNVDAADTDVTAEDDSDTLAAIAASLSSEPEEDTAPEPAELDEAPIEEAQQAETEAEAAHAAAQEAKRAEKERRRAKRARRAERLARLEAEAEEERAKLTETDDAQDDTAQSPDPVEDIQEDSMEKAEAERIARNATRRPAALPAEVEVEAEAEDVAPVQPTRPRVLKVNRGDYQKAISDGRVSEFLADQSVKRPKTHDETAAEILAKSSLSEDEEAELMAELAAVTNQDDADVYDDDGLEDDVAEVAQDPAPVKPSRPAARRRDARLEDSITDDEGAVSRILDQTNSEMERGDGSRRRAAIAHLKAAVAATKADGSHVKEAAAEKAEASAAFKDDLEQVVRPRRRAPKPDEERTRPAPLVLVSEQRIEDTTGAPASAPKDPGEVAPRRVSAAAVQTQAYEAEAAKDDVAEYAPESRPSAQSSDFAAFAASMGANGLPDILEAAAAYACYIEGRPHFTRPQVMKQVSEVEGVGDVSREEGLRSFGTLLRQGKIRKLKRGQFTISETSRFRPEAESA